MNLFSFLRSDTIEPEWTYAAIGIFWRLIFTASGRIIGESRDQEKKTASFFCLDAGSGKILWENLRLEEGWWVGMEGAQEDVLLLHGFASPDMPEHRGLRAYDVETGALLWRNDDLTYWFGAETRLFTYRDFFEKRAGYELDLRSGEVKATHDASLEELHKIRREMAGTEFVPDLTLPEILDEESAEASTLAFLKGVTKGKDVVGKIEFIRQKDFVALSYHLRSEGAKSQSPEFENHLSVFRFSDGRRIFSDIAAHNLRAQIPDSFFLHKGSLFFVKDQKTLTALRLWK